MERMLGHRSRNAGRGRYAHSLERRRAEHDLRVKEWRNLTPEARLASLPSGGAKKQRKRILKELGREE